MAISCPEAAQTKAGMAEEFRTEAGEVAAAKQCAFWDLAALVGSRSRQWTRLGFFADGLHCNDTGGSLWALLLVRQMGFDLNDLAHYPSLRQAEAFTAVLPVSGLVLTKIDSTAKGGAIVTIQRNLRVPVVYVGVGEGLEDIEPFSPEEYVSALVGE